MENAKRRLANIRSDAFRLSSRDVAMSPDLRTSKPDTKASRDLPHRFPLEFPAVGDFDDPALDLRSFRDMDAPLDEFDRRLLEEGLPEPTPRRSPGLTTPSISPTIHTSFMTSDPMASRGKRQAPPLAAFSSPPGRLRTGPTTHLRQTSHQAKIDSPRRASSVLKRHNPTEDESRSGIGLTISPNMADSRTNHGHSPPIVQGIRLVPATALPDRLRSVFKFEIFNAVQSKCFTNAFKTDDNLVIAAPTGSGKTVIMELAICRLLSEFQGRDFKIVYQAPTKSLCSERYLDWQTKFGPLNLQCAELTGDTEHTHLRNVQAAHIIITTPEKWDSVTRKWKDHAKLIQLVRLFLVDEVHILNEGRGATLEAVVSRMKSVASSVRFVALSATVPNSEDIATWLGRNSASQHLPALREVFGESFRPVELRKHVYGYEARGNDFAFESMLTHQLPGIISKHGNGKPVMIFCSTRRASMATSQMLAALWSKSHPHQRLWKGPRNSLSFECPDLRVTSAAGVAFHHGGLGLADRRAIEQGFLQGEINILCSTSTLAVGVNLPCYLVILKGTTVWVDNGPQEYADLEVMQMLGRAGRPQFETSACAVILTRKERVPRYEKMVSGEELLESCLHLNLIEHLNAEIGLGTVHDIATAKQWLASTFLFVRMKQNPSHYRFREDVENTNEDEMLNQLCTKDIALLRDAGLINQEARFQSTEFGEAMARYYVSFDSMKTFMGLPPMAKMSEILSVLAQAKEFRDARLLASQKSFYKEINRAPEIKFPIKVDIALQAHKVSLIIQSELGNVTVPEGEINNRRHQQYRSDKTTVFVQANRLIRCIIDCQIHLEDAVSTRHALELSRSLAAHVWDNTASQLRQIEGLGEVYVRKLAAASINSIDTLINTEPSRIELVLAKNPPFGRDLLKRLESFPMLRVSVKETGRELKTGKGACIRLRAEIGFVNEAIPLTYKRRPVYVCFLAETSDGKLVDFRRISAKNLQRGEDFFLTLQLTKPTSHMNCFVMCDEIAGTSKYAELPLSGIPDSVYPKQRDMDATNEQRMVGSDSKRQPMVPCGEEFDDGGINDEDLLSLEAHESEIEVVEDIDKILEEGDETWPNLSKTTLRKAFERGHEDDENAESSMYREPTRMDNGRWTCQHDCNERNKTCKHRCCKEGVAKPRRRPAIESKVKHKDTILKQMTPIGGMKSGLKRVEDGGRREKVQTSMPAGGRGAISVRRDEAFSERAAKRPKLSDDRANDLSNEELGEDTVAMDYQTYGTGAKPSSKSESLLTLQDPELEFFTFEGGDEMFSCLSGDDLDLQDAGNPTANDTGSIYTDMEVDSLNLSDPGVDQREAFSASFLTSEVDLGGLEAPLEHVALSDVHKVGTRGCGLGSHCSQHGKPVSGDNPTDPDEDLFVFFDDYDDFVVEGMQDEKSLHQIGAPRATNFLDMDLPCADTPTESTVNTPEAAKDQATTVSSDGTLAHGSHRQARADEEKRRYEEEQKKKWEGIDQWIYDEYHEYVELV